MFPYHLSTLGSLALVLLCQKVIKEFIGQRIMVRALPPNEMLPASARLFKTDMTSDTQS